MDPYSVGSSGVLLGHVVWDVGEGLQASIQRATEVLFKDVLNRTPQIDQIKRQTAISIAKYANPKHGKSSHSLYFPCYVVKVLASPSW